MDAIRIPYATDAPTDRKPPRHFNLDWDRGITRDGVVGSPYDKDVAEPASMTNLSSSVRHPEGKVPGCILEVSRHTTPHNLEDQVEHTAPYPEKLVRELLLPVARPGEVIYDPFSGSGTTGAVALDMGCNYIGVDINPNFNQN